MIFRDRNLKTFGKNNFEITSVIYFGFLFFVVVKKARSVFLFVVILSSSFVVVVVVVAAAVAVILFRLSFYKNPNVPLWREIFRDAFVSSYSSSHE